MAAIPYILCVIALLPSVNADIYTIDDTGGYGRKFDGIGGLSGGGATSKLLVNYPEDIRNQILDYLFKPNFGASLQILKVEIGGDACSTDGSEASHMHNSWDENYQRGYEWWLMVEAKKRNPNIKLYGLPWAFPGWVGGSTRDNPWSDPDRTAQYVVKWVKGAMDNYKLTIDYIGIWNERPYNTTYIKTLRYHLNINGFDDVDIVAADGGWDIIVDIAKDPELASMIQYIGVHYPGTFSTDDALDSDKQMWASEDYNTMNDNDGGGCWARTLNMNYVNGRMTSTICWNLIASYYKGLPYYKNGLMTAMEPWGGHYSVDSPIWMTAHTTQFTEIGWRYLLHGEGVGNFTGGGSYVALVSPDGKNLTIIIETMSHDHSVCRRPALAPFSVSKQNVTFQLKGNFTTISTLNVWHSKLSFTSQDSVLFAKEQPISVKGREFSLSLDVDEVYTLTTLTRGQQGTYPTPPPSKPFPTTYSDDFEKYPLHSEPFNLAQQTGSFEVVLNTTGSKMMRQMVLERPVNWCVTEKQMNRTLNLIGNVGWNDSSIGVDVKIGDVNGSTGFFVALRVDQGGFYSQNARGLFLFVYPTNNSFILTTDIYGSEVVTRGKLDAIPDKWKTIIFRVKGDIASALYKNAYQQLFRLKVPNAPKSGWVALGTDTWGIADFDNLSVLGED